MKKLSSYTFATLNGYFEGSKKGDISWHRHGGEEAGFAEEGSNSDSILLFGRVTYEMMAGYWPTPMALEQNGKIAKGMNESEKIVFSTTLKKAKWNNTRIIKKNIVEEMKKLKATSKKDMTLLGSGSILTQFADAGLIDEYQIMLDPVALGKGSPLFKGMKQSLGLKLTKSRTFKSGVILLCYEPE